jgi:hypothetical protein
MPPLGLEVFVQTIGIEGTRSYGLTPSGRGIHILDDE